MTATGFCIVQTAVSRKQEADSLAKILLEAKLAACVQIVPISSLYEWEGSIRQDDEHLLLIKTKTARFAEIETLIRNHHSYELPEIIRIPIEGGSEQYLEWIDAVVSDKE